MYGILNNLKSATDALFPIENVDKITRETLNEMIYNLENFANYINNSDLDVKNNPWHGVVINSLSLEDKQVMDINVKSMIRCLEELIVESESFANDYKAFTINSVLEFDNAFSVFDKLKG